MPAPVARPPGPAAVASEAELAAPATDPAAPDELDKAAIVEGMGKAKRYVGDCFDRYKIPGRADVVLTVLRSGRPANVFVRGDFADSQLGDCVADAIAAHASFRQYTGALKQVVYPFILR